MLTTFFSSSLTSGIVSVLGLILSFVGLVVTFISYKKIKTVDATQKEAQKKYKELIGIKEISNLLYNSTFPA